jgi:hypothetical protein
MTAKQGDTTAVSDLGTFFAGAAKAPGAMGYHEFRGSVCSAHEPPGRMQCGWGKQ